MNITEALNQILPEMPAKMISEHYPRLHSDIVFKEHTEQGQRLIRAIVPGVAGIFNLPPEQWEVAKLFDGQRSYDEVAELHFQTTGIQYTAEDIREMAANLEALNFWYKTPLEKNVVMMQKTAEERRKLIKQKTKRWSDLSLIMFPAVDPDNFLGWLYGRIGFFYTWWFTLLTLLAFGFMTSVFVTHWTEIGNDTLQFYKVADKTLWDGVAFWLLASVVLCVHEMAHGLTCKHYGAHVHAMGFALIYLTPAFYTDTTEGMVTGNRQERLMISVSGAWSELMLCAVATPLWWGTAAGTGLHDFAYNVILITGIGAVLVNWNPLMKLDGYHMLCEILAIEDLKEKSTIYVSSWVKKHVWKLPVEVPYVARRRRLGFAVYAILSGLYSYSVLFILARLVGNIFRNFSPEWSFIPEVGMAGLIFRSRIRTLVNFMKFVYLDKKDRVLTWFTPRRTMAVTAAVLVFMGLPLWHETAEGPFLLETTTQTAVRALVPGTVTAVYTDEGKPVIAGQTLVRLRNVSLESRLAQTRASYQEAAARATSAELRRADFGAMAQERDRLAQQTRDLTQAVASLDVKSPVSGITLTPRVGDQVGAFITQGTELAEVANVGTLRARFYIPEPDMNKVLADSYARLQFVGMLGIRKVGSATVDPLPTEVPPGLIDLTRYKGLRPPNFYAIDLLVANPDSTLKPGMRGTARLYGKRESLGGLIVKGIANFLGRKLW
jgi:putative peptide zinc metalloprotease protein